MFQVKVKTLRGTCSRGIYPLTEGLPRGGILSLMLWLIFSDPVASRSTDLRPEEPDTQVECRGVVFADDIAVAIAADSLGLLKAATHWGRSRNCENCHYSRG